MTSTGLEERGLLSDKTTYHLQELEEYLIFLQSMAERELSGAAISDDDYERLKYYGGWLEMMTLAAADAENADWSNQFDEDEQAAIVADVATDPEGNVLKKRRAAFTRSTPSSQMAAGTCRSRKARPTRITKFRWPLSDRLTNEKWRTLLTRRKHNRRSPNGPHLYRTLTRF
jgi:hypothetical protein